jgi:membrane-associated protein
MFLAFFHFLQQSEPSKDPVLAWFRDSQEAFMPLYLGLASLLEHIFPPFPGDLGLLAGAWVVQVKSWSPVLPFIGGWAGSILGAALTLFLGHWMEEWGKRAREGGRIARLHAKGEPFRRAIHKHGLLLVLVSRFIPIGRPLILLAAGASEVRFGPALLVASLSSFAWNFCLFGLAALAGKNWESLKSGMQLYSTIVPVFALLLLLFLLRKFIVKKFFGER